METKADRHLKKKVNFQLSEQEDREFCRVRDFEGRDSQWQAEWFVKAFGLIHQTERKYRIVFPEEPVGAVVPHTFRLGDSDYEQLAARAEEYGRSLSRQASLEVVWGVRFHKAANGPLPLRMEEFVRRACKELRRDRSKAVFEALFRHP